MTAATYARTLLAAVGLACCGGRVDDIAENDGAAGDAGTESSVPADGSLVDAGAEPMDAARDGDGARRRRDGPSIIASGTRFCEDLRECFGFDCEEGPTPGRGACVAHCMSTDDCDDSELCVGGRTFATSCFARCTSPLHCAIGFDCVDYDKTGERSCLPAPWVIVLPD